MSHELDSDAVQPSADEAQKRLGQRLRDARDYIGMSQEEAADASRIARASISAIENGSRKVSSLELKTFATLYKRPVDWFLEHTVSDDPLQDEAMRSLFRAARDLSDADKDKVVAFAQFLRHAGRAPTRAEPSEE
jgi:transcriptional regulator with XRE-family HTH domain